MKKKIFVYKFYVLRPDYKVIDIHDFVCVSRSDADFMASCFSFVLRSRLDAVGPAPLVYYKIVSELPLKYYPYE